MKTKHCKRLAISLFFLIHPLAFARAPLTLDLYLDQVRKNNSGVQGTLTLTEAADLRSNEAKLLLAPTIFLNAQYTSDAKITPFTFFSYDSLTTKSLSLGVSQLTTFGLQAKLHYDILSQYYTNPNFGPFGGSGLIMPSYANAAPVLELTQNLWSNGFGRSTRASQTLHEAQVMSGSYMARFQTKSSLSDAERSYWRLALARQTVAVQQGAVERAEKMYQWNSKRARLQLADQSDAMQSEAALKSRELDLNTAEIEEKAAARAFNSARNIQSDRVEEEVSIITPEMTEKLRPPQRALLRDDTKSAQETLRASIANSEVALELDSPTLDLFANLSLNGQSGGQAYTDVSNSIGPSFSFNRPTQTIGLRFSVPIDFSITANAREGWRKEKGAAELNYDRKVFEQEVRWKELNENLEETQSHLILSQKLELLQKNKLEYERNRLQHGRTTTYQVLLFEQDYLLSQLIRLRDQATILNVIAQMKVFGENV